MPSIGRTFPAAVETSRVGVWSMGALIGFVYAWPMLYAALAHGAMSLTHALAGDAYHYLAIARKALESHRYTYDGTTVTNGFHPLWQYSLRGLFTVLDLRSHAQQAIGAICLALAAATIGITLAAVAIMRVTGYRALGWLVIPGVFYLLVGVQTRTLSAWSALDGMESSYSVLFGGILLSVVARRWQDARTPGADIVDLVRPVGLTLPWIVLSRLDDVFLVVGLLIAIGLVPMPVRRRLAAATWIALPTSIAIVAYLLYNQATVGAAMPLSGSTKAGFVGAVTTYLTAVIHLPPLLDLRHALTGKLTDGATVFNNAFRFVQVFYPLLAGCLTIAVLWPSRNVQRTRFFVLGLGFYLVVKMGYNFLFVHPWHQAGWYYAFANLTLSFLAALAIGRSWESVDRQPLLRRAVFVFYGLLTLLCAGQFYASLTFLPSNPSDGRFWERAATMREELDRRNIHGVLNVDDGITAFLLDRPNLHGFGFAIDREGQQAFRAGRSLTLARARGIDAIAGFAYLEADPPPETSDAIRAFLLRSVAADAIRSEADRFDFALAYYEPTLHMPFFSFRPKAPD